MAVLIPAFPLRHRVRIDSRWDHANRAHEADKLLTGHIVSGERLHLLLFGQQRVGKISPAANDPIG
ncbi:MAG: hypothetical protein ACOCXR_02325, partial [Phototrophicaceae bacterium]